MNAVVAACGSLLAVAGGQEFAAAQTQHVGHGSSGHTVVHLRKSKGEIRHKVPAAKTPFATVQSVLSLFML